MINTHKLPTADARFLRLLRWSGGVVRAVASSIVAMIALTAANVAAAQAVDASFGVNGKITVSNDNGDPWIREHPSRVLATSPEIMAIVMTRSASPSDNRVGVQLRRQNGALLSCTQTNLSCDRVTVTVDPLFPQSVSAIDAIYVPNPALPDPPAGTQGFQGRVVVLANTDLRTWLLAFNFQSSQLQLTQSVVLTDFNLSNFRFVGRRLHRMANGQIGILAQRYALDGSGNTAVAMYFVNANSLAFERGGQVGVYSPSEVRDFTEWGANEVVILGDRVFDDFRRHVFTFALDASNPPQFHPAWGQGFLPAPGLPITYDIVGIGIPGNNVARQIRYRNGEFELSLLLGDGSPTGGWCSQIALNNFGGTNYDGVAADLRDSDQQHDYTSCDGFNHDIDGFRFAAAVRGGGFTIDGAGLIGWPTVQAGTTTSQSVRLPVDIGIPSTYATWTAVIGHRLLALYGTTDNQNPENFDLVMVAFTAPPLFANGFE